MIIWICGVAAVGKSTVTNLLESKIKDYYGKMNVKGDLGYKSNKGYKVPFRTYGKVMVIGREGQVLNGTDSVYLGTEKFPMVVEYEYFKWSSIFTPYIIIEGNKFISKDKMHNFMIKRNIEYKMYYLTVSMDILDERSKNRDNGYDRNIRTTTIVENELEQYKKVISKYENNVEIRSSESWQDCENIATEIFNSMDLMDLKNE